MKKTHSKIITISLGLFFFATAALCWLSPAKDYSLSERRKLAQMPAATVQSILNGKFMKDFESYTLDQFPLRKTLRKISAQFSCNVLKQQDHHEIYVVNGSASKLDYPLNENSVQHATDRFQTVYNRYLSESHGNVYHSIVPDKSYFLSHYQNHPSMDYSRLEELVNNSMPYSTYIPIFDTLDENCYYLTDPHWRQEKIQPTAERIAEGLGFSLKETFTTQALDVSFSGAYAGQSALSFPAETIYYQTNSLLERCVVDNKENNTTGGVYDLEKGTGRDPYELFLSGPVSLLTIQNSEGPAGKRLIIFRDSFGSSLAPYLVEGYEEITLIDIRYLALEYLSNFVDFGNADVLFLYSASVLNHSETIK